MKNLLKICFIATFGAIALQGIPTQKVSESKAEPVLNENISIKRGPGHDGPSATEPVGIETLQFNSTTKYVFNKNKVYHFKFIATITGFYTFEILSDVNTRLCVDKYGSSFSRIFDGGDVRGDNNARVKVKLNANQTVDVYAKSTSGPLSSFVDVTVRRGTSALFSSTLDISNLLEYESNLEEYLSEDKLYGKYNFYANFYASADEIASSQLYKKDVVIFGGTVTQNNNGSSSLNLQYGSITLPNDYDFHGTELVFFAGWNSYTLAAQAVAQGAKCAIGFTDENTVYQDEALPLNVSGDMFGNLGTEGKTIHTVVEEFKQSNAAQYFNNGSAIRVYGNPHFCLAGESVSNHSFTIPSGNSGQNPFLPPIIPGPGHLD